MLIIVLFTNCSSLLSVFIQVWHEALKLTNCELLLKSVKAAHFFCSLFFTNSSYTIPIFSFLFYFCAFDSYYRDTVKREQKMIEERREWDEDSVPHSVNCCFVARHFTSLKLLFDSIFNTYIRTKTWNCSNVWHHVPRSNSLVKKKLVNCLFSQEKVAFLCDSVSILTGTS